MRVYLDMCSIQRPLDTKSQVRIAVEAEAVREVVIPPTQVVSPLELIVEVGP